MRWEAFLRWRVEGLRGGVELWRGGCIWVERLCVWLVSDSLALCRLVGV